MRRFLLVTEKLSPESNYQDGGFFLVQTLKDRLGTSVDIMQFGVTNDESNPLEYRYNYRNDNRFLCRIKNADFIADRVLAICHLYSDIIFIHVSMLFGFKDRKPENIRFWTFPMFLTPSYRQGGENPPGQYTELESMALTLSDHLISPGYYERNQLVEYFNIPIHKIKVIPRGINRRHFSHLTQQKIPTREKLIFGSVGSIKPQKNTLGLVRIFSEIKKIYPNSFLKIIGPVQDKLYAYEVEKEIVKLNLTENIKLEGQVFPTEMKNVLAEVHIHLSASCCETFGRAIFETLSSGIPNICRKSNNAAFDYLSIYPFSRFYSNESEIPELVRKILERYETFSTMATEIGSLFDDDRLGELLIAEICSDETMIVADFDGTLYHKTDEHRTSICIERFNKYPYRVICSSRSINDITRLVQELDLKPHYIIAWSGSVIMDANGKILWVNEMGQGDIASIKQTNVPNIYPVIFENSVIQFYTDCNLTTDNLYSIRTEVYQKRTFISLWNSTKLTAIQKLLEIIKSKSKIICFGDSKYDYDYLCFYDGYLMNYNGETKSLLKLSTEIL